MEFGEQKILQEVSAGEGFSSTNTPYLVFGLGDAKQADKVSIQWMNGVVQEVGALAANQALVIEEGSETPVRIY